MKPPAQSENQIQANIVDYLRATLKDCIVFAIPNASRRTRGGKASNGVPGLLPGIPDLQILARWGDSYFIEVKTAKGPLRESQEVILSKFEDLSVPYAVCRSIDDARTAIKHWNLSSREVA